MKTSILAMAALAMFFAACTSEDEEQIIKNGDKKTLDNPVAVDFSAGIATRVNGNQWEAEDAVGISVTDGADGNYTNVKYTVAESGASATFNVAEGESPICYTSENSMSFSAYYPYAEESEMSEGKILRNTAHIQDKVDFLWATKENKAYEENPQVTFSFQHKMAQINVEITSDASNDISGKTVVISGLKHDGSFNTQTGIAAPEPNVQAEDWNIGNATIQGLTYTGLIYPQNANNITLKVGNESDNLKATLNLGSIGKFDAGFKYTLKATVKDGKINAQITIDGNTIEDWKDGTIAEIAFIGTAASADACCDEEKAAYNWLSSNGKYNVTYLPVTAESTTNLDAYKMLWAHFDYENTDGALHNAIKAYYENGGAVLASREAMKSLAAWGVVAEDNQINWEWGTNGDERKPIDWGSETATQGFTVTVQGHALFKNLPSGYIAIHKKVYLCIRKMRGWGENYTPENLTAWEQTTGAKRLACDSGKGNSITIAEIYKTDSHGCAIVIGDPAFEWYDSTEENSELSNLYTFTTNAIDYLISQSAR